MEGLFLYRMHSFSSRIHSSAQKLPMLSTGSKPQFGIQVSLGTGHYLI